MTTTLAIITEALRESNLISVNAVPTTAQQNEAMTRLNSLVASVYGTNVGEDLGDWPIGLVDVERNWPENWFAWNANIWTRPPQNSRLLLNADSAQTIWFPNKPNDGARLGIVAVNQDVATYPVTLEGNGRLIEGVPSVILNDPLTVARIYSYVADTATWTILTPLTLASDMPFPIRFDDYFITKLASRLNPRYGRALSDESRARLVEVQEQMSAYYRQKKEMPAPGAVLRISDPGRLGFMRGPYGWMR